MTKKHNKKNIVKIITEYGIHIWAILIIANAALVYAFNFAAQANNDTAVFLASGEEQELAQESTGEEAEVTPTGNPKNKLGGATINLAFSVPGIGSGGGTLKPVNLKRDVTIYLFSMDANSLNPTVKPLYTVKGSATFDTDTTSKTYTAFVNKNFDLGTDIPEGDYQMAFRTNQSARTLIRENKDKMGGMKITLRPGTKAMPLELQSVNMGDVLPEEGDNVIDISDYNAFINCFNNKKQSDFCRGRNYGDFDDNGIVDGIDYNIMLRSFSNLLELGQAVPQLTVAPSQSQRVAVISSPTPEPAKKEEAKPEPTKAAAAETKTSGSSAGMIGGLLFFIFLILMAAIGFILYKKNEKVRTTIRSIIHLSPTGKPGEPATDPQAAADTAAEPADQTQTADPVNETQPAPTEQPVEGQAPPIIDTTPQAQTTVNAPIPPAPAAPPPAPMPETSPVTPAPASAPANAPAPPPPVPAPAPAPAPAAPGSAIPPAPAAAVGQEIEKDVYVKVKGPDEAGTGQMLLLSDDNGPVKAHYAKNDAKDGFAKVKGVMKTENGTTFLEVSELTAE